MRILRLEAAHFGKLENFVLEPREGLNIYCRPNEFGKTTLVYFIYYMFYGYDARLLKGYLPWNGSELAGSLTFEQGGKEWRIERRRKTTEKRQILCLTTGEELALAQKEQPGPYFLGLDGATFLRTFCITQGDLLFSRTDGLDVALKNMAATGDENVSFKLAEDWLNKQHTRYMYRGKNQGPLLDQKEELAEGILALQQLRQQLGEQIGQHREWEQLEKEIPASDERLNALRLRLKKAEGSDALRLLQQLEAIRQKKPLEPPAVSKEKLDELEKLLDTAEAAREKAKRAEEEQNRLAEQLELISQNLRQLGFHALSGQELEKLRRAKRLTWQWILPAVGILCLAAALLIPGQVRYLLGAVSAACLVVFTVAAVLPVQQRKRICHSYGAANSQQLEEKWGKYQQVLAQQKELQAARKAAAEAAAECRREADALSVQLDCLREQTRLFGRNDVQQLRISWGVYENSLKQNDTALQEQALLNGRSRAELEALAAGARLQEETAPQVRALLEAEQAKNRSLRDRRDALDPRALEALWVRQTAMKARNKQLKYAIREGEAQLAAVQTALGWLKEANQEMNTRFAPKLCALAGEHLARLTGGKYQKLLMDASFGISLETAEGTYPLERFSAGTRDGVYFAFRLAVSTLLCEEVLPMVLDDPFVNLDAQRLEEAEELLKNAAKERQILYFTCHETLNLC
ncbi:MAG: AAA family ATPase [Clostridia bacterium]|nr:AAA family ATPase [Clostridia bacterium]